MGYTRDLHSILQMLQNKLTTKLNINSFTRSPVSGLISVPNWTNVERNLLTLYIVRDSAITQILKIKFYEIIALSKNSPIAPLISNVSWLIPVRVDQVRLLRLKLQMLRLPYWVMQQDALEKSCRYYYYLCYFQSLRSEKIFCYFRSEIHVKPAVLGQVYLLVVVETLFEFLYRQCRKWQD